MGSNHRWFKLATVILGAVALVAAILVLVNIYRPKPLITAKLKKAIAYTVFVPSKDSNIVPNRTSVQYDASLKLLSYIGVQKQTGVKLTFSEQTTPESFVDIPQAYDKLIESLNQYSAFDSFQGKVYLTIPTELKGGQSAVMNAKGTLMFVKPDKDLNEDAWKLLFNNLEIAK